MSKVEYIKPNMEEWLQKFHFETEVKVRFSETDAFGHVNNVSHIIYFEQARLEYFQELGVFDFFMNPSCPTMIVTADIHCHYLAQIYFGQPLSVKVRIARLGQTSVDIQYAIVDKRNQKPLASGRGAVVHINKATGKSAPWPEEMRHKVIDFENLN